MYVFFQTDRLTVRPLEGRDADFICQLVQSEGWLTYLGDRGVRNRDDARAYIKRILDIKDYYYSIFEERETGEPAGVITFLYREDQRYPDIGFALLPKFAKRGLAYEAAHGYLLRILKEQPSMNLIAITTEDNIPSIRLIEKLGLRRYKLEDFNGKSCAFYSLREFE
jgi:RimJ/RimL family protein N-acetyltransferase